MSNIHANRTSRIIFLLAATASICIFLSQLWTIHALWTPVGFVDTWPLFDRLMRFHDGEISWDHYLFDPHVHPHAIVFILYLIDTAWGSGRQLVPHFATILSIVGVIGIFWKLASFARPLRLDSDLSTISFYFGSAILLSGISEASIIPFQSVVIVTRFIYILLLALLIYSQFFDRKLLHGITLFASAIAVTFYASGGLFALEIILLHLLFFRRWIWLLCSFLPLAAYLAVIALYTRPSAETDALASIIHSADLTIVLRIVLGSISYYASALVRGWIFGIDVFPGFSEGIILSIGAAAEASTTAWAVMFIGSLGLKIYRRTSPLLLIDVASCLMALVSLWVFASSLSASLLWLARAKIFGTALGMPAHYAVLTSERYVAFSCLSYVVLFYMFMRWKQRRVATLSSGVALALIFTVGLSSLMNSRLVAEFNHRNDLEIAATALLLGMSPADPEASALWPGVASDWHWPTQLIKTVAYIRSSGISYAYYLPQLGQIYSGEKSEITGVTSRPVAEKPVVCKVTGKTTAKTDNSIIAPQRIFSIAGSNGEVIGYALKLDDTVIGHLMCGRLSAHDPLFLLIQ